MPADLPQYDPFMLLAIEQARLSAAAGDVPVGAVIVRDGAAIAAAHNRRALDNDPTAHAEMLAIRQAAALTGDWRLTGCTMVVTLEPCCMCAGAMVLARMDRLVYGASDPKTGAVATLYQLCSDPRLNHQLEILPGLRSAECGAILTQFFSAQRALGKK
ncbi:MAG: tRNA adenosine(34) deaminase TadA [Planctomycetaceae bacterium]|nr:tRNA adenosine(34) deaminase TadA [Planctomycetaceae bacterium]